MYICELFILYKHVITSVLYASVLQEIPFSAKCPTPDCDFAAFIIRSIVNLSSSRFILYTCLFLNLGLPGISLQFQQHGHTYHTATLKWLYHRSEKSRQFAWFGQVVIFEWSDCAPRSSWVNLTQIISLALFDFQTSI